MGLFFQETHNFLSQIDSGSVFVEIGSDRLEGSTLYFANLAKEYNTILHTVDITTEPQSRICHDSIEWHTGVGSEWCKDVWPMVNKKISLLYLDNFDYNWNTSSNPQSVMPKIWNKIHYDTIKGEDWPAKFTKFKLLPIWIQQEILELHGMSLELTNTDIEDIYTRNNLILNNNNCQIEHFKQIHYLFPYLSDKCLIVFDDTYLVNECWIGKNGPGVIFLQANGFNIVKKNPRAVILAR
jgi:hypothetical protein